MIDGNLSKLPRVSLIGGEALFDESRRGLTPPGARFNQARCSLTGSSFWPRHSRAVPRLARSSYLAQVLRAKGLSPVSGGSQSGWALVARHDLIPLSYLLIMSQRRSSGRFFLPFVASGDKKRGSWPGLLRV